jgi:hypothetical protein
MVFAAVSRGAAGSRIQEAKENVIIKQSKRANRFFVFIPSDD